MLFTLVLVGSATDGDVDVEVGKLKLEVVSDTAVLLVYGSVKLKPAHEVLLPAEYH